MDTNLDKAKLSNKAFLLDYYRHRAEELLATIKETYGDTQYKERASEMNKGLIESKDTLIKYVLQKSRSDNWTKEELLNSILTTTYSNYVVMIEARNDVWPYEYMTFSRRIGELWEPFCQLCWEYPVNTNIAFYIPPLFNDVRKKLHKEIEDFISKLKISDDERKELLLYYEKVWVLVSSGEIKLELDLHFTDQGKKFNVDFKSGFSSNEKGNTNRLLLVASIYKILEEGHICELYVRSMEEKNNHYLQTLKRSGLWNVYCGEDTYKHISTHTGFNLMEWIKVNVNWEKDFDSKMYSYIKTNHLDQYLEW